MKQVANFLAFVFCITLSCLAQAQDRISNDAFIQDAVKSEHWQPGGKNYSSNFDDRGTVIEQSGAVDINPALSQTLGNFKLESASIQGGYQYVIDITEEHTADEHSPFDETSRSSDRDRQNNPNGTQSSYAIEWQGQLSHPANGYDPPQDNGFPTPDPRGAIDIVSYNIQGIATGIYPLTQAEIQQRDLVRSDAVNSDISRSVGHFSRAGEQFEEDGFGSTLLGVWSGVKGAVDWIGTGSGVVTGAVTGFVGDYTLTPALLTAFRYLSTENQFSELRAMTARGAVMTQTATAINDLAQEYPTTTGVITELGYMAAVVPTVQAIGRLTPDTRTGNGSSSSTLGNGSFDGEAEFGMPPEREILSPSTPEITIDNNISGVGLPDQDLLIGSDDFPDTVIRQDNDFYSPINHNGGPKSHLDEYGNLIPPNPNGNISTHQQVRGGNSQNSNMTSTTDPNVAIEPQSYGDYEIEIDTRSLQNDINSGTVEGVSIRTPKNVRQDLQRRIDTAQTRYDNNPSLDNRVRLERAQGDLNNAIRDGECLISGCIPSRYITGPRPVED